jgi:nucleoside-diphosphate-sugar epimerase
LAIAKNVLITGGLGFIGAHLANLLLINGSRVTLFDNCEWSNSSAAALKLDEYKLMSHVQGSIMQPGDFRVLGSGFDYIVHAAGVLGITKVAEQQILTMDVNIIGTRNVLDFSIQQKNLQRYIQFSTSEIYGQFATSLDEDQPAVIPAQGKRWCYAASKVAGEYLVKAFASERQLPAVIVRPFNVYGPYRYGSNALTSFVQHAIAGRKLTVSGTGRQTRSWCYVQDFVNGVFACLNQEGILGQSFNIGNDQNNISMLELAHLVCEIVGSSSEIQVDEIEIDDVLTRKPNIDKARRLLSYEPTVELRTGIEAVVKWLKS